MSAFASQVLVRLDPRAREPLQAQLCASLRRAIRDGVLQPGTRLPSSRSLAEDLRISRTTAVLAFDQLAAEGLLVTRSGTGTYVSDRPPADRTRASAVRDSTMAHPPLSKRGAALATTPRAAIKLDGHPKPFRIGTPGLDRVPLRTWARLVSRRFEAASLAELDYGEPAGLPALRTQIAEHVRRVRGASCTADQVIVVSGAQDGLSLMCRVLLDPGDTAWLEEPGYTGARAALVAAGARIASIPVDRDGIDVEAGARRVPNARLAYVTPAHQFPLAVAMTLARRQALLAWARRAGAWILEDDYDSGFHYGSRPLACLQGLDVDGRVIYVGSFSKTLFPALRLGYVIVPPDLRDAVAGAQRASKIHHASFEQAVMADFMASGAFERHLLRMRQEYRRRFEALAAAAAKHGRGLLTLRPLTTGLHAVADVHGADDASVVREAMARGVEVMPMSSYCFDRRRPPATGLLLGFAAIRTELFEAGMIRLAAAIRAARRGTTRPGA